MNGKQDLKIEDGIPVPRKEERDRAPGSGNGLVTMADHEGKVRVGDRVEIDGAFGAVRSIGYSGGSQLIANVDMDDGRLCVRAAASLAPITKAAGRS